MMIGGCAMIKYITNHGRKRSSLPSAPLDTEYNNNRYHRAIVTALNIDI
jgi:hypothetical protein